MLESYITFKNYDGPKVRFIVMNTITVIEQQLLV